jgi:L-fuconate dehydratase
MRIDTSVDSEAIDEALLQRKRSLCCRWTADRQTNQSHRGALSGGTPTLGSQPSGDKRPRLQSKRVISRLKCCPPTHIKMKVGRDLDDDVRRLELIRGIIGPDRHLLIDANQVWEVDEAIEWVQKLQRFEPYFIEEPTSPDDVEGHRKIREAVAPVKVATGEMCQNRILFKQFMARGAVDIVQIDACRLGGLNEVLAVLLLAAKHQLPVWPHAGGVGLCEYVQHLAMIDYLVVSATKANRLVEYVDHLHEHFIDPCVVINAAYMPPCRPGFSIEMKPQSIASYARGERARR